MNPQNVLLFLRHRFVIASIVLFVAPTLIFVSANSPLLASTTATGDQMLGVTWTGVTYRMSPNSSIATPLGFGAQHANSMALSNAGTLLISNNDNRLYTVDPIDGNGQLLTIMSGFGSNETIRGMAFTADDRLVAVAKSASSSTGSPFSNFYEIDISTGVASFIGSTGANALQSLAISLSGTIYSFDMNDSSLGLVTIDPITGFAIDVDPYDRTAEAGIQSLAFDSSGTLIGVGRNAIYSFNLSDGSLTQLSSFDTLNTDIRGIEFLPIPEPSSLALLVLGSLVFAFYRKSIR